MTYTFTPMTSEYAHEIVANWKYEGDFSIYDYSNEKEHMLDEEGWKTGIFAVLNESNELIGECSIEFYDEEGNYTEYEDFTNTQLINRRELWIGFGMRPDLVGKGIGPGFVDACVQFSIKHFNYEGQYIFLGVATFNQRALKAYQKCGFEVFETKMDEISGKSLECAFMRKEILGSASQSPF